MEQNKLLKMIRMDIPYENLDLEDDDVVDALEVAEKEIKYNAKLYDFLEMAYPWQKQAIKMTADHRVVGVIASNQSGKSEVATSIVACLATGIIPDWWEGRRLDRPVKIMVAGVDSNHNKNVIQEKLIGINNWRLKQERGTGMIPRDFLWEESAVSTRGDGLDAIKVKHISGGYSEIIFRAYSQGREAAQGFQADVIMIDEQPKDDFWSESLVRTAATNGFVICSFTPLLGMTGLVEELFQLPTLDGSPKDKYGDKYKSGDGWAMVRATWEDINHISEGDKVQLRKGFAAYEADARTFGIPIAGHGRIFPFQRGEITYDHREVVIQDSWEHIVGIDIGHGFGRDPSAAILVAWDKDNEMIYVTNGFSGATDTTRELAKLIVRVEHQCPVAFPADANRSSMNSESTVAQQLRQFDINLLNRPFTNPKGADGKRNNHKMPGIKYMSEMMAEGRLKISAKCTQLLDEIDQYSYTETGKIQDGKDHNIDAMRYAVMSIIQGFGAPLLDTGFDEFGSEDEEYNFY